jgi:hypothetical protein
MEPRPMFVSSNEPMRVDIVRLAKTWETHSRLVAAYDPTAASRCQDRREKRQVAGSARNEDIATASSVSPRPVLEQYPHCCTGFLTRTPDKAYKRFRRH